MATTTSAKAARKAARESALAANAEQARRTKLNVDDLTAFFASTARAAGVDDWLAGKIAGLEEQAAKRRDVERRVAGAALASMRDRGELIRDIARLARIGERQVRELIRLAGAPAGPGVGRVEGGDAVEAETPSDGANGAPGTCDATTRSATAFGA